MAARIFFSLIFQFYFFITKPFPILFRVPQKFMHNKMSTAAVFLDDLIALLMVNKVIKNYQDQRNEVKKKFGSFPISLFFCQD